MTDGGVRLWWVPLDRDPACRADLTAVLDDAERARIARFATPTLRARHTVARGALRRVLAGCLGCGAREVLFEVEKHGKPVLDHRHGPARPAFNLSHASGHALIAVAGPNTRIGVDLEPLDRDIDVASLTTMILAPEEAPDFLTQPEPARTRNFLRIWTRKEAYLKATGAGLTVPPDCVIARERATAPGSLVVMSDRQGSQHPLFVLELTIPGFAAALAVSDPKPTLQWLESPNPRPVIRLQTAGDGITEHSAG